MDVFLKMDGNEIAILRALNDTHRIQNYHPLILDGEEGFFAAKDYINKDTPADFKSFFMTLPEVVVEDAKITSAPKDYVDPFDVDEYMRAAYNPYGDRSLPEYLYHYTSAEGFLGIVTTRKVWASHYAYLNDYNEFEYAKKIIRERLLVVMDDTENHRAVKQRWELFEDWFKFLNTFVASFSADHDRLSQWRGYSNSGRGYCLGFKTRIIGLSVPPKQRQHSFKIRPVLYDAAKQIDAIDSCINKTAEDIKSNFKALESSGAFAYEFYKALHLNSLVQIVTFKSPTFQEEREWRAIHLQMEFPDWNEENLEIHFKVTGENIVPFVKLDLDTDVGDENCRFPLSNVTYGPALNAVLSSKSISMILKNNKLDNVEIRKSELTLR